MEFGRGTTSTTSSTGTVSKHKPVGRWESRITKIFKIIIIRVGFTFKKFLKLKFYRGIIFHGSSDKNQQKPRRAGEPSTPYISL